MIDEDDQRLPVQISFGPSGWEIAAQIAAVANASLILLALIQLFQARRVSTAALIVELNNQFDNAAMMDARAMLRRKLDELKLQIQSDIVTGGGISSDALVREKLPSYFARHLQHLRSGGAGSPEETDFRSFIAFFGFFESTGALARRRYIPETLVMDLFRGPAGDAYLAMSEWVAQKEKEPGMQPGLLENAIWLGQRALDNQRPVRKR